MIVVHLIFLTKKMINKISGNATPAPIETNTASHTLSPKELFYQKIDAWRNENPPGSNEFREGAADGFKSAYDEGWREIEIADFFHLSTLPDLSQLSNLEELIVMGNNLTNLPALPENLKILEISSSQLASLPDTLPASLQTLSVSNNKLSSLPDTLPASLQTLRVSNNRLSSLPDTLPTGLETLEATNNQISSSPNTLPPNLQHLYLQNNQLTHLSSALPTGLKKVSLHNNPLIFLPEVPLSSWGIHENPTNLRTLKKEFSDGNQNLLDFSLNGIHIPGTVSERGLVKMQIMLDYANHRVTAAEWAFENSGVINQIVHQASVLPNHTPLDRTVKALAQTLSTAYLQNENVALFAQQAEAFVPWNNSLIFVTSDGQQGITLSPSCYEKQILNAPFANQDDPHAEFTNGVLIHQHNQALPVALSSPEDLKPFSFLNEVYKTLQNREMLNIFLTSLNMSEEYKKRFTEALIVSSVGILARDNGTTEAEKADLAPYKMVDPQSSRHLFDVFSVLVNENTVSDIDRLVNPNATLTDTHFAQICQAFPSITADHQAHLVFALAAFFVISSAQPFFGTADDSPIAIRFYVNALINKLHTLNPSLFNQINGDYIKGELLKDSCTDSLSSSMRASAKSDPLLKEIYERVVPKMWQ